jgi:ComF family protein
MLHALLDALAVLLPVECAGCGSPDRSLCASCRTALTPEVSSRPLSPTLRVWSGLEYDGVARAALLALKRDGRLDVAKTLALALASAVTELGEERRAATRLETSRVHLVPVPGSRSAYRRRGYDPVTLLMRRAALTPSRLFAPARPHAAQKTLDVESREHNLRDAFRLRSAVAGQRILLIDDIVTSGATLREAARVLTRAGAEVIGAAAVASTPLRFAPHTTSPVTRP